METFEPNKAFNFESLTLANPQPIQGGSFFTRATINDDKPLYIQLPKCNTKNGIINTKRGKYSDLLYEKDRQEELIEWTLALEKCFQNNIYQKKNTWFHNEISLDDIETMMTPIFRLYKSGSKLLIRTYIDVKSDTNEDKCLAYNEQKIQVSLDSITEDKFIIPLLLIEGIKFTSKSFEIVIKLVQTMILDKVEDHSQICLIKHNYKHSNDIAQTEQRQSEEEQEQTQAHVKTEEVEEQADVQSGEVEEQAQEQAQEQEQEQIEETTVVEQPEVAPIIMNIKETDEINDENRTLESIDTLEHIMSSVNGNENENVVENDLEEISVNIDESSAPLNLKRPNEVYYEIYKNALSKAKHLRKVAVEAFL